VFTTDLGESDDLSEFDSATDEDIASYAIFEADLDMSQQRSRHEFPGTVDCSN
jgi:hypothetical protein